MTITRASALPGLLAAALALSATSVAAQTSVRPGFNIFSVAQDVEIGRQSALQVERQLPMLDDPTAQRYVSALGTRLAAHAPGARFRYQFKVANLSDVNAFALPGGYIYVHRGLLEQVRTEGELAAVLAHEIAHVSLRHPTSQASKAYLAQAGLGVLGGLFGSDRGSSGSTVRIVNAIGGFGLNTLFLKFSRSFESQADVAGSQMMAKAGYDPLDMARFFALLGQRSQPGRVARFLSDHPSPSDREARIRQEARLLGSVAPSAPVGSLASLQGRLRRHPPAPSIAQVAAGAAAPGRSEGVASIPAPATRYRIHHARGYRIELPENWTATAAPDGYGVTLAPRGGVAGNEVAYGVIVNHYVPFEGSMSSGFTDPGGSFSGASLESATADLVAEIRASNPHLSRVGATRRHTVSGAPALSVALSGRAPRTGVSEQVTVVTRRLSDGHVAYALLIAPSSDYAALEPTFRRIVGSLQIHEGAVHE